MRSLLRSASTLGNSLASYAINLHPPTLKNITKHNLTFSKNNPFTILLPHLPKTAFLTEDILINLIQVLIGPEVFEP